jgi:hypothetical protein
VKGLEWIPSTKLQTCCQPFLGGGTPQVVPNQVTDLLLSYLIKFIYIYFISGYYGPFTEKTIVVKLGVILKVKKIKE